MGASLPKFALLSSLSVSPTSSLPLVEVLEGRDRERVEEEEESFIPVAVAVSISEERGREPPATTKEEPKEAKQMGDGGETERKR